MSPHQPCHGCKFAGSCCQAGLVNRLAVDAWLADNGFQCADYTETNYRGIEGVRP